MKRIILLLITLLISSAFGQSSGLGNTDTSIFTKYKVPITKYTIFNIDGSLDHKSFDEQIRDTYDSYDNIRKETYFQLNPQFLSYIQSEKKVLSYQIAAYGILGSSSTERKNSKSNNYKSSAESYNLILRFSGIMKNYDSSLNTVFKFNSELYYAENNSEYDHRNNFSKVDRHILSSKFGIGFGRMRDITAVVQAIRFQERAKQVNLINKDFDEESLLSLAQIFSRENHYDIYYDRSKKYLWNDVDKSLKNSNCKLDELNLYSASYLFESLNEIRFRRNEGFEGFLTAGLEYVNSDQGYYSYSLDFGSELYSSIAYLDSKLFLASIEGTFEYSHQLGLYSQFSFVTEVMRGYNLNENKTVKSVFGTNFRIAFDYELSDKLLLSIANLFNANTQDAEVHKYFYKNNLGLFFKYYIEDQFSLNTEFSWQKLSTNSKIYNRYGNKVDKLDNLSLRIGFNYFIDSSIFTK